LEYDRTLAIAEIRMDNIRMDEILHKRQCDWKYSQDLGIKPAIIWLEKGKFLGLLCFRCRYGLDYIYDQKNEAEKQHYEKKLAEWKSSCQKQDLDWKIYHDYKYKKEYAEWQSRYGVQWRKKGKRQNIESYAIPVAVVTFFTSLIYMRLDPSNEWDKGGSWNQFGIVLAAMFFAYLAKRIVSDLFSKDGESSIPPPPEKEMPPNPCPPPSPLPPGNRALCGFPELLFDSNKNADFYPYWYGFDYGKLPEDWEKERAPKCRHRDNFSCCLCGKKQQERKFDVHHVIPKGKLYKGSHSLQNLVTLCQDCHAAQEYYDHKILMGR